MKRLFIYKGLELEANINGYATYELLCCAQHNNSMLQETIYYALVNLNFGILKWQVPA